LIRPTSGSASILGHDVKETAFRREIGFLPENAYFYDYLTGRELLDFYARLSGVPSAQRPERVSQLLDWVGMTDAADVRVRAYSKGMAQRVGIAQALVHDPSVVFLDEPMSGLDPIGRKEIRDLLIRLRSDGKTVFMNTHILSDVEMVCDRVAIIVGGRIRYQGRTEEFLSDGEKASEIVVSGVTPEFASSLEEDFEVVLRGVGERIELRVQQTQVETVLAAVLKDGGRVMAVTPQRVSLESIFMDAVMGEEK
jgi:ABC-2 type transport system ATP-binding protein